MSIVDVCARCGGVGTDGLERCRECNGEGFVEVDYPDQDDDPVSDDGDDDIAEVAILTDALEQAEKWRRAIKDVLDLDYEGVIALPPDMLERLLSLVPDESDDADSEA